MTAEKIRVTMNVISVDLINRFQIVTDTSLLLRSDNSIYRLLYGFARNAEQ